MILAAPGAFMLIFRVAPYDVFGFNGGTTFYILKFIVE
jgi:hypothetical protein